MSTSLWVVTVIVVAWTSFLIGYGVSALTAQRRPATEVSEPAGGYAATRERPAAATGGYGDAKPGAKAAAGGYGEARSAPRAPAGAYGEAKPPRRAPAGGYGAPTGGAAGSGRRPRSGDSSSD